MDMSFRGIDDIARDETLGEIDWREAMFEARPG